MKITTSDALLILRPNSLWSIIDNEINWYEDNVESLPSKEEIAIEIERLQAEFDSKEYQRLRKEAYPPIEDYLDAVVKGNTTEIEKYINTCLDVKARFPKG
jgi:hypothetical protein